VISGRQRGDSSGQLENLDPNGGHTGDFDHQWRRPQTLTDREYQRPRGPVDPRSSANRRLKPAAQHPSFRRQPANGDVV